MKMIKTQNKKQQKYVKKLQALERYGENLEGKKLSVEQWQFLRTFQFWNRYLI